MKNSLILWSDLDQFSSHTFQVVLFTFCNQTAFDIMPYIYTTNRAYLSGFLLDVYDVNLS